MGAARGVPSPSLCLTTFCQSWTSWAGWPQIVMVDRGKEWMAEFADRLTEFGVEVQSIPLEAPWQLGLGLLQLLVRALEHVEQLP